jgi:hypothetical protein
MFGRILYYKKLFFDTVEQLIFLFDRGMSEWKTFHQESNDPVMNGCN